MTLQSLQTCSYLSAAGNVDWNGSLTVSPARGSAGPGYAGLLRGVILIKEFLLCRSGKSCCKVIQLVLLCRPLRVRLISVQVVRVFSKSQWGWLWLCYRILALTRCTQLKMYHRFGDMYFRYLSPILVGRKALQQHSLLTGQLLINANKYVLFTSAVSSVVRRMFRNVSSDQLNSPTTTTPVIFP